MHDLAAVWLRVNGKRIEVLVETAEGWRVAISEPFGPENWPVSHICEPSGIMSSPLDEITECVA